MTTLIGVILFYSALAAVDIYLMIKTVYRHRPRSSCDCAAGLDRTPVLRALA
jgi:hypothetical protein